MDENDELSDDSATIPGITKETYETPMSVVPVLRPNPNATRYSIGLMTLMSRMFRMLCFMNIRSPQAT